MWLSMNIFIDITQFNNNLIFNYTYIYKAAYGDFSLPALALAGTWLVIVLCYFILLHISDSFGICMYIVIKILRF
jgi:hypothetical protein